MNTHKPDRYIQLTPPSNPYAGPSFYFVNYNYFRRELAKELASYGIERFRLLQTKSVIFRHLITPGVVPQPIHEAWIDTHIKPLTRKDAFIYDLLGENKIRTIIHEVAKRTETRVAYL